MKRTWWHKVLWIIGAVLVAWLLSGCHGQREMPALEGLIMGLGACVFIAVMWWAAVRIKRIDDEALVRWSAVGAVVARPLGEMAWPENADMSRWDGDALTLPTTEKMRRILGALIVEGAEVRNAVLLANRDGSVEDYGDRLAGVARRLHGMILCQANLSDRLTLEEPKWDVHDLLRGHQLIENEAAMLIKLMTSKEGWLRFYRAPSTLHRPAHGGYAS